MTPSSRSFRNASSRMAVVLMASVGLATPIALSQQAATRTDTNACVSNLEQVAGTITDATSGEGVAAATVTLALERTNDRERGVDDPTTTTNDRGSFAFDSPCVVRGPSGGTNAVVVVVTAPGYREKRSRIRVGDSKPLAIALEPLRVVRLDDVVVLAPQTIPTNDNPSIGTLDAAALEAIRGRHLAGTLAEIPGVTMLQAGPASAKPVVRGQFGRRLLTLFDGVRHESQDWGIDHAPEIDPFAAGELSVVKGAAGVRYGPDAIGGVVRIEPRPLRFKPGIDGELHLVGVDNGLRGTIAGRIDAATSWLPGFSLRLEGNGAKGASVSAPDYVLGNTGSESLNGAITAGYTGVLFGNLVEAKLSLRHHQARLGVCFCLAATTPDDLRELSTKGGRPVGADAWRTSFAIERPYQTVSHDLVLARLTTELFGWGEVTGTYSFQFDVRNEFDQVRRAVTRPQFHFELATHAADLVYSHPTVEVGRFSIDGVAGGQFLAQENVYSGLQLIPNYRKFLGGVFGVETLTIEDVVGGTLVVDVGARYDQLVQTAFLTRNAYSAQLRRDRLSESSCTVVDDVAQCPLVLPAVSVSASANWTTPLPATFGRQSALTLAADLGSATRFPDADELYLGGRSPSFPVFGLGNGSLGSETTYQAGLALSVRSPIFAGEVSAYANQVQDYIAFGPAIGPNGEPQIDVVIQGTFPRYLYESTDALFYGLDVSGIIAPRGWLSLSGQLSMVRGLNATTGGYLPFVPPPQGRVTLSSQIPAFFVVGPSTLSATARGVIEQTRFDRESDFVRPPRGYMLVDAAARTQLDIIGQRAALSVEVNNVFNQRTREYLSLLRYFADQPGREIWLRLSVDFQTL